MSTTVCHYYIIHLHLQSHSIRLTLIVSQCNDYSFVLTLALSYLFYISIYYILFFFFSSRRRHTRFDCDWSSDVCSSDLDRRREDLRPSGRAGVPDPNRGDGPRRRLSPVRPKRSSTSCARWRRSTFERLPDRKSTRLNSSHSQISYAVFCLKKKNAQPRCTRNTDTRDARATKKDRNSEAVTFLSPGTPNIRSRETGSSTMRARPPELALHDV